MTKPKGHWPAGKRRHTAAGVELLRQRTARLLRHRATPKLISRKALARAIHVSDRTVRRWLAGEDLPRPVSAVAWRRWLARKETT